jgi:hypothetical protein
VRLAFPPAVHRIPVERPEQAVRELTALLGELREGTAADLQPVATEAVETALREDAFLMAVVAPPGAAPAMLTGVVLAVPPTWDGDTAESLRDAVEDRGGPDVRETVSLETGLGPAVLVQRVPGLEQARERRALTVQLQAFVPEPGTGRMLLLTLASPSAHGWAAHQELFASLVASARPDEMVETNGPVEAQSFEAESVEDQSFEDHTYRL